jgi:hypothetical protein
VVREPVTPDDNPAEEVVRVAVGIHETTAEGEVKDVRAIPEDPDCVRADDDVRGAKEARALG